MKKGFTMLEVLMAVLLIGILTSIGTLSYSNVRLKSQDSRRKTDLEELRSALEQYRSQNNAYPTPTGTYGLQFGSAGLTDSEGNVYMQKLPQDPLSSRRSYYYTTSGDDYTLATQLTYPESTACASPPGGDSCGTGLACNYCLGSYGKK